MLQGFAQVLTSDYLFCIYQYFYLFCIYQYFLVHFAEEKKTNNKKKKGTQTKTNTNKWYLIFFGEYRYWIQALLPGNMKYVIQYLKLPPIYTGTLVLF